MKKESIWAVYLAVLGVLALFPVTVLHQVNGPKEDPEYIRRVWGQETVGQVFRVDYAIDAIDVLLRSTTSQTQLLEVVSGDGNVLATREVATRDEDVWVHIDFTKSLPAGGGTLIFRAPSIQTQDSAILVRYQVDSAWYESGNMVVNGEQSYGDIAFRTYEDAPLWRAVIVRGQITDKSFAGALQTASIAALLAAGVLLLTYQGSKQKLLIALALLVVATLALRAPYTHLIEGVFGGDAFNYYSKASTLVAGSDPFAADPRKGPIYSFLLVPGLWQRDPLLWSRWVGIAAAGAAVLFTMLSARALKLSWPLAVGAGILLAVSPEFIWEAPNGLANSLFAALIIISSWAYLKYVTSDAKKWLWWLAVFLGLTALTRYEGVLVAAVLLPAALLHKLASWKAVAKATVLAGAIMAIPFVSYIWSGVSGIRTISDLEADGGLFIVNSFEGLQENLSRAQGFFAGTWLEFEKLQPVMAPYVLGLVLAGVGAALLQAYGGQRKNLSGILLGVIAASMFVFMAMKNPLFGRNTLIAYTFFASGAGTAYLLFTRFKKAFPLALVALLQTIVIILILPKSRYFLSILPFMSITMVAALQPLAGNKDKLRGALATFVVSLFAVHVLFVGSNTLEKRVEVYNGDASRTAVLLKALTFLRSDHGNVTYVADYAEEPMRIYLPEDRRVPFKPREEGNVEEELAFLKEHRVKYVLERKRKQSPWQSITAYPDVFEHAHTFESIYGEDKVLVYKVLPENFPK